MADTPIPPALSPAEWGRIHPLPRVVGGASRVAISCGLREPGVPGERALSFDPATEPHALMAALNATLPHGHPGQITREDVEALVIALDTCEVRDGSEDRAVATGLSLAAKLAALLPPEDA